MSLIRMYVAVLVVAAVAAMKDDCPSHTICGDVEIPYPFATQSGCYLSDAFKLTCNDTFTPPVPIWGTNVHVSKILIEEGLLYIQSYVSTDCSNHDTDIVTASLEVHMSTTTISSPRNKFTVVGCDSYGYIRGTIGNQNYTEGCVSKCDSLVNDHIEDGSCSGSGCCQIDIPRGLQKISVKAYTFNKTRHQQVLKIDNPCSYAFIVDTNQFNFSRSNLTSEMAETVPVAVDWAITTNGSCNGGNSVCKQNAECYDANLKGYRCKCKKGYRGNPYVGCQGMNI